MLIFSITILIFFIGFTTFKTVNSKAFSELQEMGEFNFETLPKQYSNSFNSRIILWKASADLLHEDYTWLVGLGTQNFQEKLDEKVRRYNHYLPDQHLTSHNLFLSFWMQYGIIGIIIIFTLFYLLFRESIRRRNISAFLLTLFLFFSVQTEIYLDREMGVHLFIWCLLIVFIPYRFDYEKEFDVTV